MADLPKKQSIKERMAQYQEEIRLRKEQAAQNRVKVKVSKLDEEKKDVARFVSPTRKKKLLMRIAPESVGKLNESLTLAFDQSMASLNFDPDDDSDDEEEEVKPPVSKEQALKEEEEAKDNLADVLEKNFKESGVEEPEHGEAAVKEKPFTGLQKRYLKALNHMRPKDRREGDAYDAEEDEDHPDKIEEARARREESIREAAEEREVFLARDDFDREDAVEKRRIKRREIMREETTKREQFVEIRTAWDRYEEKAQDRPDEPSPEEAAVSEQIKKAEDKVVKEWSTFAERIVEEILEDPPDDDDSEIDDIADWVNEARRMRGEQRERRRRKNKNERKRRAKAQEERLMKEDRELLEEAKRLREKHKKREALKKERLAAGESISDIEEEERAEEEAAAAELDEYSDGSGSYYSDGEYSDESESDEDEDRNAIWVEEARKLREQALAQKEAEAQSHGTSPSDVAIDEDSGDDEEVIDVAKRLRRAHIRELEGKGDNSFDDKAENLDDFIKWLGESREIVAARKEEAGGEDSNIVTASHQKATSGSVPKKKWYEDSSDEDSDDDIDDAKRAAWREEARKLRTEAIAKQQAEAKALGKPADSVAEESSDDEEVVKKALKLRKKHLGTKSSTSHYDDDDDEEMSKWLEEARKLKADALAKKQTESARDDSDSSVNDGGPDVWMEKVKAARDAAFDEDPRKDEWMEEAKRLNEKAFAKKKAEAIAQGKPVDDLVAPGGNEEKKIIEEAFRLEKAHQTEQTRLGHTGTEAEASSSSWIQQAIERRDKRTASEGDHGHRDAEKEAWLELARQFRQDSNDTTQSGAQDQSTPTKEDSSDDEEIVEEAQKLRRAHIEARLQKQGEDESDDDDDDADDLALWVEAARQKRAAKMSRRGRKSRSRQSRADGGKGKGQYEGAQKNAYAEVARKKWYEDSSDESSDDDVDDAKRAAWREEARKLRSEAAAKKEVAAKAVGSASEETDESSDDEDVVEKALKLQKKYKRSTGKGGGKTGSVYEEDSNDMSKFLEEARRLKAEALAKKKYDELMQTKLSSAKKHDNYSSCTEPGDDITLTEKDKWLEEARRLRAEAISKKKSEATARGETINVDEDEDEDSDHDEEVVRKALKLEKAHRSKHGGEGNTTREERGGMSKWLVEARKLKAEALAKKAAAQKGNKDSSTSKGKIFDSDSDSDSSEPEEEDESHTGGSSYDPTKSAWKEQAKKLRKRALAKFAVAKGEQKSYESSEDDSKWLHGTTKPKSKGRRKPKESTATNFWDHSKSKGTQEDKSESGSDSESESINIGDDSKSKEAGGSSGSLNFWDSFAEKTSQKKAKGSVRSKENKTKKKKKKSDDSLNESLSFWDSFSQKKKKKSVSYDDSDSSSGSSGDEDSDLLPAPAKNGPTGSDSESIHVGDGGFAEKTKQKKNKNKSYNDSDSSSDEEESESQRASSKSNSKKGSKQRHKKKQNMRVSKTSGYGHSDSESEYSSSESSATEPSENESGKIRQPKNPVKSPRNTKKTPITPKSKKKTVTSSKDATGSTLLTPKGRKAVSQKKTVSPGGDNDSYSFSSDDSGSSATAASESELEAKTKKHRKKSKKSHSKRSEKAHKTQKSKKKSVTIDKNGEKEQKAKEKKTQEEELKKQAKEADAKRKAKEAEAKRKAKEAEVNKKIKEAEEKKKAKEAEIKKKAKEEEEKKKAKEEADAKRKAEKEAESKKKAEEEEEAKKKKEEAAKAKKKAKEEEAKKKAEEEKERAKKKKLAQKPKPPRKKEDVELGSEPGPLKNKPPKIDTKGWKSPLSGWHNAPPGKTKVTGAEITMKVPSNTECWRRTRGSANFDTAPVHWQEVNGDFEVVCKIGGEMQSQYDKAGIMIRLDESTWVFSGMEYCDGRLNNSTIVTMDSSDRSVSPLPPNAAEVGIWFCIKRIGNSFECFYSYDVRTWVQTRQGLLTTIPELQVGICGASPQGDGFDASWSYFKCREFEPNKSSSKKK